MQTPGERERPAKHRSHPEDTGTASPQPTGEKEQPSQQVPEQKENPNPPETSPQTPEAGQTEAASQAEQPEETASPQSRNRTRPLRSLRRTPSQRIRPPPNLR